jgi:DNA repair protein RecN (Recombination protein N)
MAPNAMLRELGIKNLAVVEAARLPLLPGLTVLTGETGAGKSIVVDALLLVAGARAHPDLVRTGEDTALVEAVFDVPAGGPLAALLEDAGHEPREGQLVIRREISRAGRHRVWVNDSPATVGLLERLGELLVEVHGQHEHQRLLLPARQLEVLDRFAEAEVARDAVSGLVRRWQEARDGVDRLRRELGEAARQEDLHRFQLSEIDAVAPQPGEEDALRAERTRLAHAERIRAGLEEALGHLTEDGQSAAARLSRATAVLRGLGRFDPETAVPLPGLEAAAAHLEDAVAAARQLRDRPGADPDRLQQLDARLDALAKLKRKYGATEAAILAYRDEVVQALERVQRADESRARLEADGAEAAIAAARAAETLSALRVEAAERLGRLVQREVRGLGMEHARVRLELRRERAQAGELGAGDGPWRVGPRGAEGAELLLSANPGEDLRPLAKVVSGGELSRTMLAVRAILASADEVPTLAFDEVDAGVGGRVADAVGQKLRRTATGRQVLCVTHLAPIAAHAHHHLLVEKRAARGVTRTSVTALDEAGRVEELARMLGGERVTDTSRRHARELLRAARAGG